jgi:mannitol/fructose-specific phosphotransferase system IIA component (Ntr-type)
MYSVLIGAAPGRSKATVRRLRAMLGKRRKHSALANYVRPDLVNPELKGSTKVEVIDELLGMLATVDLVSDTDAIRADVLAREDEMPTVVGHGVAIPHARTDHVEGLVCAVGIHHEGVDFNGPNSEKTKIVVLTLSPKTGSAPHIQFMAMVSRALDESGRRRAMAAKTRAELWEALVG